MPNFYKKLLTSMHFNDNSEEKLEDEYQKYLLEQNEMVVEKSNILNIDIPNKTAKPLMIFKYILFTVSIFLFGMVFIDIVNHEYHIYLVISVLLLFTFDIAFLVEVSYHSLDKKMISYSNLKKKAVRLLLTQQSILITYIVIVIIIILIPRRYSYHVSGTYNYFTNMISYDMTFILPILFMFIPVIAEVCIYYQYSRRINPYRENLLLINSICYELNKGNLNIKNPFHQKNPFYNIVKTLVQNSEQAAVAADRIVKNEKMKIDLITNMSHDLKTPLTSIISTLDLLKKMELPEDIKEYAKLLSSKSAQLKKMIEILFEISKAGSGTLNLLEEKMDMNRLINQLLADMSDQIEQRESEIKTHLSKEPLVFLADNQALYQVCQNLLDNAIKYSLKNTRIYIRTLCNDGMVCLRISNTANYEMNFTNEEIAERFIRGDASRTTDGNGLGLAIAKTYTEACKGIFNIGTDGDQFFAMIQFKCV